MKTFIITLALAGLASTATLDAQVGGRPPTPTRNTSINIDGSWRVVGRDGSGYDIYERRTRDANGNILVQRARRNSNGSMTIISSRVESNVNTGVGVDGSWRSVGRDGSGYSIYERRIRDRNGNTVIQRARRDANGNMTIISSRTVASNDNGNNGNYGNCDYNRSTNSIGDIIFGRTNSNLDCDDTGNRVDGGWYQMGRGRDNNSIYERRTRDANGNLVIQRARRNSNGTMTIISTRYANDNDKQWRKAQQQQDKNYRKNQKQEDKNNRKSQRDDDDNDNRYGVSNRDDDRYYVSSDASAKSNGKGNGKSKAHKNKH